MQLLFPSHQTSKENLVPLFHSNHPIPNSVGQKMDGKVVRIAAITTVATLATLASYAVYFDYSRRNNPEFRKKLGEPFLPPLRP